MSLENQAVVIGVNVHEWKDDRFPTHIVANIVLIDQANPALKPLLYQFNEEASLDEISSQHTPLVIDHQNAFKMMGEILEINRHKKIITLENEITVSYKHLIVAFGTHSNENKEANIFNLIDALKVQKRVHLNIPVTRQSKTKNPIKLEPLTQCHSQKLLHLAKRSKMIHKCQNIAILDELLKSGKKLYEVQI